MNKRIPRKLLGMALVLTMAFSIAGCSKNSSNSLNKVKKNGKIVIGTSADYPPYEFHNTKGGNDVIAGFDIDIAKEVAKDLGVELEIKDMDFDGLLAALSAGKVDMVIAGMTPDAKRRESADFSKIYYRATQGVVMRKGEAGSVKSMSDLNGKVIGVQQGSIQDKLAEAKISNPKEIRKVPKVTDLVLMLQSGKVDAVVMELPVAENYVKTNSNLELTTIEEKDEEGGSAIAVKKNNPDFVAQIDKTIDRLLKEDKISKFYANADKLATEQSEK